MMTSCKRGEAMPRLFAILVCLNATVVCCAAAPAQPRPNILFIYADDHSAKTVSCYEGAYPHGPHAEHRRAGRGGSAFSGRLSGIVVHAVASLAVDRTSSARDPVHAHGGRVSRQHL